MKNYDNNKTLFNYILSNKYEIIKDPNSNEIMKIIYNNSEIKCKYNLLFTIGNSNKNNKNDKKNNILSWSYSNPYIDQKTKLISLFIKNALDEQDKNNWNWDWDNFTEKNLIEIINIIIKENLKIYYDGEFIEPIWIIKGDYSKYSQYYMITDIVYF
jgi:hypothetical protein